jgi:hypothetical protein
MRQLVTCLEVNKNKAVIRVVAIALDANGLELKECPFQINTTAFPTQRFTLIKSMIKNFPE